MALSARPQYILRLPGISLSTYKSVEDLFDEKILNKLESQEINTVYDKVPNSFSGLRNWPKQTNLKCITCDRLFREIPKFYPKDLARDGSGNIEMSPIDGFMCSFACVRRYIDFLQLKRDERWNAFDRLNLMYEIFTGEDAKAEILHSPNKTEREEYGGTWDMHKYITELKKVDRWLDLNHKILERIQCATNIETMVTNCVLTGTTTKTQITENHSSAGVKKEIADEQQDKNDDFKWESLLHKKYDDAVAYD